MLEERFHILLDKYLSEGLNKSEEQEFEKAIKMNPHFETVFKEHLFYNVLISKEKPSNESDKNQIFANFIAQTKPKPKLRSVYNKIAIGFSVFLIGAFFTTLIFNQTNKKQHSTLLNIESEEIILYNENGKIKEIKTPNNQLIKDFYQDIQWGSDDVGIKTNSRFVNSSVKAINYTLKIPYGKKLTLNLSDGTKVFLNSGSTLTYPSNFKNSDRREVTLSGEAYFEVTKNIKKPFIVKTKALNIRVLGTKFNVSSYKGDETSNVVLLEGSVAVNNHSKTEKQQSIILKPNEQVFVHHTDEANMSKKNVNAQAFTSWTKGELFFNNEDFLSILKKLQRNYNVKIISTNELLNSKKFTGRFTGEDIFDILNSFKVHTNFKYEVQNNRIQIN